jgi:transcriptional regulator with XRE-family HTH domain
MIVGDRLKAIREEKDLSQGDIEKRTGLLRCYISRVENGHTVPAVETLEKIARALEIPLYQLFYDGDEKPTTLKLPKEKTPKLSKKDSRVVNKLIPLLAKMKDRDKRLLVTVARKMSAS